MISQANYQDEYQQIMDKIKEDTGIKVDLQVLPDDQYFDAVNVKLSTGGSTGYHDEYDSSTLCSGECS